MRWKRFKSMLRARNLEFFRDKAAFGWNFLFPFFLIVGFSLIFGGKAATQYKIGLFPKVPETPMTQVEEGLKTFFSTKYLEFIGFDSMNAGMDSLEHHRIDLLLENGPAPHRYWVTDSSPKGYLAEKLFQASLAPPDVLALAQKEEIHGIQIRYIDWLFPGILAMNMMFSALWGVGYVVVRYRKNGVLKRLKATPLTAFEYLSAQMISRLFLLLFTVVVVWIGCDMIFHFHTEGSYLTLFIVFAIGALSLTSMGLLLAARGTSEEFTTGALNFITWPMMFLSEVWFSLEGAPRWIRQVADIFPLTHMLRAIRKVMNDGAGIWDVSPEIVFLLIFTAIFLFAGAALFSWTK
jgi:ABC-2 type transport system permease protein